MRQILGVDVGGVILVGERGSQDTIFQGDYLKSPSAEGVFVALRELRDEIYGNNIHIVSKCGPKVQQKTREWLEHHRFYDRTGINRDNVHFCLERHQKAPICREYEITAFIDDKLEVLSYLHDAGIPNLILFNPKPKEIVRFQQYLPYVHQANNWKEVLKRLRA